MRRVLADGTVKLYRYPRKPQPKPGRYAAGTVAAALLAYENSPEWRALAEPTRRTYRVYIKSLAEIGSVPLADVKRRLLLGMRDAIAVARGNGAGTGFIRAASSFMTWCVSRDLIEHNPAAGTKKLAGGHLPAWTTHQAQEAMERLPEPLRRVVVLAFHTGQRRGDLARLPWSAYDGQTIRLKQSKTGVSLVIPAHPLLRAELDAWKREATSTMILTTLHGRPWMPQHISHMLPPAMVKIGLPGLNVHGLRKLAATTLADAGCTVHEIAAITGHKSLGMVALYTASADQERLARSAVTRLETTRRKRGKTAAND